MYYGICASSEFGCAKFAEYIVGLDVTVESNHKPLEAIMKKPLHVAPLRLQRVLVQLQRFQEITVVYKRGKSLHLADALSRAHLKEYLTNAEQLDINLVEHVISDQQLAKFVEATKENYPVGTSTSNIIWLARFQRSSPPQCTGILKTSLSIR